MLTKTKEEYLTPRCHILHFELSSNVMSSNPQYNISNWEDDEEEI